MVESTSLNGRRETHTCSSFSLSLVFLAGYGGAEMIWNGIIGVVMFLFIFALGGYSAQGSLVSDCETLGAFRIGETVYKCERALK